MTSRDDEKYRTTRAFVKAKAQRAVLRALLRPLVRWPRTAPCEEGYTVVIACGYRFASLLIANLRLLERQERTNLREIIISFDGLPVHVPHGLREYIARRFAALPIRWVHYNRVQTRVLHTIRWGWVYSWLSWCIGIAQARTRYVMLHDLDALLLDPGILERRYGKIRQRNVEFLGAGYYHCWGLKPSDGLATTFELMLDAPFVRKNFRPIDLFNHVTRYQGRRLEFDTLLYAQTLHGRTEVDEICPTTMMHPSQMICQMVDLMYRPHRVPLERNSLPLIPYFLYLAGEQAELRRLPREEARHATLLGHPINFAKMGREHAEWLVEQARRVEFVLHGRVRDEVQQYMDWLIAATTPVTPSIRRRQSVHIAAPAGSRRQGGVM